MKSVAAGMNPMDLKRGIDMADGDQGHRSDQRQVRARESRPDSDEVAQVGTISANGEAEIGRQIAGRDGEGRQSPNSGVITVEENKGLTVEETENETSWKACSSTAATCPLLRHQPGQDDGRARRSLILLHEKKLSNIAACWFRCSRPWRSPAVLC